MDVRVDIKGHEHCFESGSDKRLKVSEDGIEHVPTTYQCDCGQMAYNCPTCGFVLHISLPRGYDNITFLAGDAGLIFDCLSCGEEISRIVQVKSFA